MKITNNEELAWRSGIVRDCHTTARGSIPGGNGVFTELHVFRKGQIMGVPSLNDIAVEPTNQQILKSIKVNDANKNIIPQKIECCGQTKIDLERQLIFTYITLSLNCYQLRYRE